ncbi:MAG TPA: TolC family protein [Candidatus Angelobacter sp.]|nr:TolC family protein [Candidatus Angelobacter sp.]
MSQFLSGSRILPVCVVIVLASFTIPAAAQLGAPAASTQTSVANQVPLSGRTAATGSVVATQSPVPGATTSVNTINPTVQVQGAYAGSVRSTGKRPFSGKLSLREAVERGLEYNLGGVGLSLAVRQAHGQAAVVRSALMPNVNGSLAETVQQTDLAASGLRIRSPLFAFPTIVGPFNFFDLRARLSQAVVDLTAWNNYKSVTETTRASQLALRDARDLVVLGVGGAYLQTIAAAARLDSAKAQLETANALFQQTSQQRQAGVAAQVDVDRSEVQVLTQRQRLASLQNDLAKQKINLARMTGLPPNDQYELSDAIPFSAGSEITVEKAVDQAVSGRADLKAAETQVRAAEKTVAAARAERLPSLAVSGDYGVIGVNPAQSHGTFSITGTLRVPLWQGGRAAGDIEQAQAALSQRQAELEDQRDEIEGEVRKAYLDLQAAATQVEVAQRNIQVAKETLDLTRQRFQAGVSDNVQVVQAQESVSTAELDYINSVFAHNLAKLSLARAMGSAVESLSQVLKTQ